MQLIFKNDNQTGSMNKMTSRLVFNNKSYIKYKLYPNFLQDHEQQTKDRLSQKMVPKFKLQVSYLARFTKYNIEKEVFNRWMNSDVL